MGAIGLLVAVVAVALAAPAGAVADYQHVVMSGETLTSVAAQDGLSVAALAAANGLSTTAELIAGSVLQIPPQTAAPATTVAVQMSSYIVQPGDTLTAIADRAGTTVSALAALNGLDPNRVLLAGATLTLPAATTVTSSTGSVESSSTGSAESSATGSAESSATTTSETSGASAEADSAGPPYPTHEFASAAEIAQIAASNGVPAGLAQAIGWQESGFNNDEVSSAGAVGVMQITPSTWSWINQNLTNGTTLAPASAYSNVTGGVLLLRSLLADTGSESLAAAGYYQGLSSVRRVGMYSSTQQYVADVLALSQRFGG